MHLCASEFGSDTWDYREAGYDVRFITKEIDVRTYEPPSNVYGIIANPPCTMFSKARIRAKKPRDMMEGMELVLACLKIIWKCQSRIKRDANPMMPLKWWALENPDGYLKWFLGKPAYKYSPHEFGSPYVKWTNLWGMFNDPSKLFFTNQSKTAISAMPSWKNTKTRSDIRSIVCPQFAKAFFLVNP